MILSRYFDFHVYETSKLFQVSKEFIFSVVTSYKISWKSGITNLLGTNKRHEETNYCAFYDGKKFNYAERGLYVRWWLQNVKCQTSNHVTDSSDQKLSVVPSLPKFRVSQTFIHILFLFYFVMHYIKKKNRQDDSQTRLLFKIPRLNLDRNNSYFPQSYI